jgi:hypothetical protein
MCFFVTILGGVELGFAIHFLHDAKTGHGTINSARHAPRMRSGSLTHLFQVFACEGEQGNMTGLLHGRGHHALVSGAGASLATWADLAIFSDIFPEQVSFFIIYDQCFICTKLTKFRLCKEAALSASF